MQYDIDWNVVGTDIYETESVNLQDLLSLIAILHLENDTVTDTATGKQYILKRNETDTWLESDIYEDSAGIIPYDEQSSSINKRTRFKTPT